METKINIEKVLKKKKKKINYIINIYIYICFIFYFFVYNFINYLIIYLIILFIIKSHLDTVRSLSFHHTDKLLLSSSDDGTAKLWNLEFLGNTKK